MDEMIHMKNVGKSYRLGENILHVLKQVDFSVWQGEFVAVLGASGSGKSTLMNILGCMDTADAGSYRLDGADVGNCGEDELTALRNRKIGFIFQKYHLVPQYTVLQNVILPLLARGMSHKESVELAAEQIADVGLLDRLEHKPGELSGGQQQRVAIARALVGAPAVLLADEPTGALDRQASMDIMELFHCLHNKGNTIVMITHDQTVAQHSQRVFLMEDGILQESA